MSQALCSEKALIFRIVHVANLPWMVENGIQCRNSLNPNPDFISIGSEEIIESRSDRAIPIKPGGAFSDYVPFYFTPYSIMMYNIKTGYGVPKRKNEEIVICVSSLRDQAALDQGFVFANQHACSKADLRFSNDLTDLDEFIDWEILQKRDFKNNPDDPGKLLRYQAEAMVRGDIPLDSLRGIVCYSDKVLADLKVTVSPAFPDLDLRALPQWYF